MRETTYVQSLISSFFLVKLYYLCDLTWCIHLGFCFAKNIFVSSLVIMNLLMISFYADRKFYGCWLYGTFH